MSKTLAFIYDTNPSIGMGHVRRSQALAAMAMSKGFSVSHGLLNDSKSLMAHADLVVFDFPGPIDEHVTQCRREGRRSVALDYFGDANPDLVISVFEHRTPVPSGHRVSGFDYVILRQEMMDAPTQTSTGPYALVVLGGGDVRHDGRWAATELAQTGLNTILVEGPYANYGTIDIPGVKQVKTPSNLPELMRHASVGVTNAGGSLFEMLYWHRPVHVLPQTTQEDRLALYMHSQHHILGQGRETLRSTLAHIQENAPCLTWPIDGHGKERIIDQLRGLL